MGALLRGERVAILGIYVLTALVVQCHLLPMHVKSKQCTLTPYHNNRDKIMSNGDVFSHVVTQKLLLLYYHDTYGQTIYPITVQFTYLIILGPEGVRMSEMFSSITDQRVLSAHMMQTVCEPE